MNYKKGTEVLPDHLLREIQKYVEGSLLYIPKKSNKAGWGYLSGGRQMLDKRNKKIINLYQMGKPIRELAEEFHLCDDTIMKIVYKKNRDKR